MLLKTTPILPIVLAAMPIRSNEISLPVVVRDHLLRTTSEIVVTGRLFDSSAGSWVGNRPGIDGLPTRDQSDCKPVPGRCILQTSDAFPGWPGRIAVRLDRIVDGSLTQECSGTLVGPNFVLTASHCVHSDTEPGDSNWISDSFYVRPGFDRGRDLPLSPTDSRPLPPVRVLKSWISKSSLPENRFSDSAYGGDDDWAVLELERDVGTELGWARVAPLDSSLSGRKCHVLSYPAVPLWLDADSLQDTATRRDSLSHSWAAASWNGSPGNGWYYPVSAWRGESGSGLLDCPDSGCMGGQITVRGTRWFSNIFSSLDSVMSGIICAILKDVKVPVSLAAPLVRRSIRLAGEGAFLRGISDRDGEWKVLTQDGRTIVGPIRGKSFSIERERLPYGIVLVVFRERGEAPVVRRWLRPR
jgi:hypothetical protein